MTVFPKLCLMSQKDMYLSNFVGLYDMAEMSFLLCRDTIFKESPKNMKVLNFSTVMFLKLCPLCSLCSL
jgi:hypothetical protein